MKLIIQIPCLNEEETLPITLNNLPKKIDGIDTIEILIINDGSSDGTVEVARLHGVHHIINFKNNRGLAKAFTSGIDACLKLGADIIVNTDADNQYHGEDIPRLIQPILSGNADVVVGDRETDNIDEFSKTKKFLQKIGSYVVRKISHTSVTDTTSGFRAYSREAALQINVLSDYTYTLETIIQAGMQRLAIENVKINTNPKLRSSKLFNSMGEYLKKSILTILRIYATYRPLKVFVSLGLVLSFLGIIGFLRFFFFLMLEQHSGHIQSLVISAALLGLGFQVIILGVLSDLIAANRKLLEQSLIRIRKMELEKKCSFPEEKQGGI